MWTWLQVLRMAPAPYSLDFTDHYAAVHRYLHRFVGDHHAAEDLAQETCLRALRRVRARGPPRNPRAWLLTIAHNVGVDYFSRKLRMNGLVEDGEHVEDPSGTHPIDALVAGEDWAYLEEGIAALRGSDQDLLRGFYRDGKGCRELGQDLGIPYPLVKVRLFRARERLARRLR